ncbi:MAG TPA: hypothetical protein VND65_17820 [Candidatus Binatia bacterium]|nr:hypothetical protein [Candidatus Binatia bacterium]
MSDYEAQRWYDLYKTAVLELEHAAMTGRISDARTEIATRLQELKQHPGLHADERQAIDDALRNLRFLEKDEARLAAEEKERLLREAAQKLKIIEPKLR